MFQSGIFRNIKYILYPLHDTDKNINHHHRLKPPPTPGVMMQASFVAQYILQLYLASCHFLNTDTKVDSATADSIFQLCDIDNISHLDTEICDDQC